MSGIREQMASLHPELLVEFRMFDVELERSLMRERLMAWLTSAFGLLAGLLAALGLYGVMSYMVARRRGEIGVRLAMGATAGNILSLAFRQAGLLVLLGLAVGLAGAIAVTRVAQSMLFGLAPNDPSTRRRLRRPAGYRDPGDTSTGRPRLSAPMRRQRLVRNRS